MKNIILIGFMGSGKTAVGKKTASALRMGFLDMDALIEQQEGREIKDIFRAEGEAHFRKIEKAFLEGLKNLSNVVISTGGGIVKDPANRSLLRKIGAVIYLDTNLNTILKRLEKTDIAKRPVLSGKGTLRSKIFGILKPRIPLYRSCAHYILKTSGRSPNSVTEEIVSNFGKKELRIGSVVLGEKPVIVTTIGSVNPEILDDAQKAGADIIELRVDEYEAVDPRVIIEDIKKIRRKKFPVIMTVRKQGEGGVRHIPDERRLAIFEELTSFVDAVDVEFSSASMLDKVIGLAHKQGKPVIVSYHEFSVTPPATAIVEIIKKIKKTGADIIKICTMANSSDDVLTLAMITQRHRDKNLVTLAMGEAGSMSRALMPMFGSLLTYGFTDKPHAPGQVRTDELKNIFKKSAIWNKRK